MRGQRRNKHTVGESGPMGHEENNGNHPCDDDRKLIQVRDGFHGKRRPKQKTPAWEWLLLAGSACVLVLCAFGLFRYISDALRSTKIQETFQAIYFSGDEAGAEQQDLYGSGNAAGAEQEKLSQQGPVLRQYEVTFPKASSPETDTAAPTTDPVLGGWPGNPSRTISAALQKLRKRNRDVIGWLSIPDMLEQAVVQRDNTWYLKRDYLGNHNANGALFLEEGISLWTRPDTYIIFGHNMKTGEMFGSLRLYEDLGYYRRHAVIVFNALYEDGKYVVFAVADVDTEQHMSRYVPFMQLPGMEAEQRNASIQKLKAISCIRSPIQADTDDQLLLLVTCEGSEENRRVVAARRLREGETAESIHETLEYARKQ